MVPLSSQCFYDRRQREIGPIADWTVTTGDNFSLRNTVRRMKRQIQTGRASFTSDIAYKDLPEYIKASSQTQ